MDIETSMNLLNQLPEDLKRQVGDYIEFLYEKYQAEEEPLKKRKFGCAKGMFEMSEDFDEPLEDFKAYME